MLNVKTSFKFAKHLNLTLMVEVRYSAKVARPHVGK